MIARQIPFILAAACALAGAPALAQSVSTEQLRTTQDMHRFSKDEGRSIQDADPEARAPVMPPAREWSALEWKHDAAAGRPDLQTGAMGSAWVRAPGYDRESTLEISCHDDSGPKRWVVHYSPAEPIRLLQRDGRPTQPPRQGVLKGWADLHGGRALFRIDGVPHRLYLLPHEAGTLVAEIPFEFVQTLRRGRTLEVGAEMRFSFQAHDVFTLRGAHGALKRAAADCGVGLEKDELLK